MEILKIVSDFGNMGERSVLRSEQIRETSNYSKMK